MKVLLVRPIYSQAGQTKHPAKLAPVGLYKLHYHHKEKGDDVFYTEKNEVPPFQPDVIKITSLFTYWSKDVFDTITHYKELYPDARIEVGGIMASLVPEIIQKEFPDVFIHTGLELEAEEACIDWNEIGGGIQIIHGSRGCHRKCKFCGVHKVEPDQTYKTWDEIKKEIQIKNVVFFDNNFLESPYIKDILKGLSEHKVKNDKGNLVHLSCECQSGFDARLITPEIAEMLKKARFKSVRIAWDHNMKQMPVVRDALQMLIDAGYPAKQIGVFMLFNWDYDFDLLEQKRKVCKEWNVQIFHCRFRPLDQLFDNYSGRKKNQTSDDYYIHHNWSDKLIKQFSKNVREQNIVIRFNFDNIQQYYDWVKENKKTGKLIKREVRLDADLSKWIPAEA